MRVTALLRRLIGLDHTRVIGAEFGDDGIVIDVAPSWRVCRCSGCGETCKGYDQLERRWRHLGLGGIKCELRYSLRRAECPKCGVRVEQVPWAECESGFTKPFEGFVAVMAQKTDKTTVTGLMRIAWYTVGRIIERATRAVIEPMELPSIEAVNLFRLSKLDARAREILADPALAAGDGVKALRAAGSLAQVVTLSNNASSGFIKALGDASRGVIVTQVFPYEKSFSYALVKEALDAAKAKGITEISPAILEGYAGAKVLVEALRRASPNPTRQKVLTALEGMQKFDLGGLEISYSPEDHTGLDFADLSIIGTDGKFKR